MLPLYVTGNVMPGADISDEELWTLMQQPAIVVDLKEQSHQKIYSEPNKQSKAVGSIHGQSVTLSVYELEENWARVGAWRQEDSVYVEGWIPAERLKVVVPSPLYGIVIDKHTQQLKLYHAGEYVASIPVSTGFVRAKSKPFQETAPGSFVTMYHMSDFRMNGLKYDHVIRFDGGNLLHASAWRDRNGLRDYSEQNETLGQRASHGCVRMRAFPAYEGDLNAYWLFTHLQFNTRVIVLPDESQDAP